MVKQAMAVDLRAAERRAATARAHAARALKGLKEKTAAASDGQARAAAAARAEAGLRAEVDSAAKREEALRTRLASLTDELAAYKALAEGRSSAVAAGPGAAASGSVVVVGGAHGKLTEDDLRLARARWEEEWRAEEEGRARRAADAHERYAALTIEREHT